MFVHGNIPFRTDDFHEEVNNSQHPRFHCIIAHGGFDCNFPADAYPHGPVTVTISGENGTLKDACYLQLYNQGGVSWNEGIPKDPPQVKGMSLVFAEEEMGPSRISTRTKVGQMKRDYVMKRRTPRATIGLTVLTVLALTSTGMARTVY